MIAPTCWILGGGVGEGGISGRFTGSRLSDGRPAGGGGVDGGFLNLTGVRRQMDGVCWVTHLMVGKKCFSWDM